MPEKNCSRCGGAYDADAFFGRNHARYASLAQRRPVCLGCEQKARDASKRTDRWMVKARDTVRRHARKFNVAVAELRANYGWEPERLAHDAEHAYRNGCPYCRKTLADMGHGLADITLDVVDPQKPPYYTTNTRWCCQTCNREKSRTDPSLWAAKLIAWAKWEKRQQDLATDPWLGTLFEGTDFAT